MKILYELILEDYESFKAKDFPDRFEILRKGKTPLVFKPVAITIQDIYSRLNEAEKLLKIAVKSESNYFLNGVITEYFERHAQ